MRTDGRTRNNFTICVFEYVAAYIITQFELISPYFVLQVSNYSNIFQRNPLHLLSTKLHTESKSYSLVHLHFP
jgi:hypothetical protein